MQAGLAVVLLLTGAIDMPQAAQAVTSMVSAELGEKFTVLTGADIQKLLELTTERQLLGCDEGADATSCLAELGEALGTRYVVKGKLNKLGDWLVLELTLLDSETADVLARIGQRDQNVDNLANSLEESLSRLSAKIPEGTERILVMDLTTTVRPLGTSQEDVWRSVTSGVLFTIGGVGFASALAAYLFTAGVGIRDGDAGRFVPVWGALKNIPVTPATFVTTLEGACALTQITGVLVGIGGVIAGIATGPTPKNVGVSESATTQAPTEPPERLAMAF